MDVEEGIRHKSEEISGGADGFGGGFPEVSLNLLLKEFTESVEVALRPGYLTILAGSKEIPSGSRYCCTYWAFCSCPSGVTGRFLFNFQPRVDVRGKQSLATLIGGKVPDFVNLANDVPEFHGLDEFWGAAGAT